MSARLLDDTFSRGLETVKILLGHREFTSTLAAEIRKPGGVERALAALTREFFGDRPEPVLCGIAGSNAYFTTQALAKTWGDDWRKSYAHNHCVPYGPCPHNGPERRKETGKICRCKSCMNDWTDEGEPRWRLVVLPWCGPFFTPDQGEHHNPNISAQAINQGLAPWLRTADTTDEDEHNKSQIKIMAGTTMTDFIRLIESVGGGVGTPRDL